MSSKSNITTKDRWNLLNSKLKIFYISIFLISIPPFSIGGVTIHMLAKLMWVILFVALFFEKKKTFKLNSLILVFLIQFIFQSISIVSAKSIMPFFRAYEDLLLGGVFFFVAYLYINNKKKVYEIFKVVFYATIVNIIFQIILFLTSSFPSLLAITLPAGYVEILKVNLGRGRLYVESYSEVWVSIFLMGVLRKTNISAQRGLGILIGIMAFISNFRSRLLMLLISGIGLIHSFIKESFMKVVGSLLLATLLVMAMDSVMLKNFGFSIIDRVQLTDKSEDVTSVTSRFDRWNEGVLMGLSEPAFGVGLGNYYDHLKISSKFPFSLSKQVKFEFELAKYYPHNMFIRVFSETGVVGLSAILMMLMYFGYIDISKSLKGDPLSKTMVFGFWSLVTYSMINPTTSAVFYSIFWMVRVLIYRLNVINVGNHKLRKI